MFQDANLYSQLSRDHEREAEHILDTCGHLMKSKPGETILDIGAGSGDVTCKVILPRLHPKFSLLVASDLSNKMVDFGREKWTNQRIKWIHLDAQDRNPLKTLESNGLPIKGFDKIFSFFALQWASDSRKVAENVAKLLNPGGQALIVMVARSDIFPAWDKLAKSEKWSPYFKDVKTPFNRYQYMEHPEQDIKKWLIEEGLRIDLCSVQFRPNVFTSGIESEESKKVRMKSIDPLVHLLPESMQSLYIEDLYSIVTTDVSPRGAVDYTSLIIVCTKSDEKFKIKN